MPEVLLRRTPKLVVCLPVTFKGFEVRDLAVLASSATMGRCKFFQQPRCRPATAWTTERYGSGVRLTLMRACAAAVRRLPGRFKQARRVTVLAPGAQTAAMEMMTAWLLAGRDGGDDAAAGQPEGLKGYRLSLAELTSSAGPPRERFTCDGRRRSWRGEERARYRPACGCGGGTASSRRKGLALAALKWMKPSKRRAFRRSAFGWAADATSSTWMPGVSLRCGDYIYCSQAAHVFGQLTRRWDQPVVVARSGRRSGGLFPRQKLHWTGSAMAMAQDTARGRAEQGQVWTMCCGGGTFGSAAARRARRRWRPWRHCAWRGTGDGGVQRRRWAVISAVAPELMMWPLRQRLRAQFQMKLAAERLGGR